MVEAGKCVRGVRRCTYSWYTRPTSHTVPKRPRTLHFPKPMSGRCNPPNDLKVGLPVDPFTRPTSAPAYVSTTGPALGRRSVCRDEGLDLCTQL